MTVVIAYVSHVKGIWIKPVELSVLPLKGDHIFNSDNVVVDIIHLPDDSAKKFYGYNPEYPLDAVILYSSP